MNRGEMITLVPESVEWKAAEEVRQEQDRIAKLQRWGRALEDTKNDALRQAKTQVETAYRNRLVATFAERLSSATWDILPNGAQAVVKGSATDDPFWQGADTDFTTITVKGVRFAYGRKGYSTIHGFYLTVPTRDVTTAEGIAKNWQTVRDVLTELNWGTFTEGDPVRLAAQVRMDQIQAELDKARAIEEEAANKVSALLKQLRELR